MKRKIRIKIWEAALGSDEASRTPGYDTGCSSPASVLGRFPGHDMSGEELERAVADYCDGMCGNGHVSRWTEFGRALYDACMETIEKYMRAIGSFGGCR